MVGSSELKIVADEAEQVPAPCSDALLLDAWKSHRDTEAFAALVDRYSRLVMGVCRRQCRTCEDAEDAFQATFLILSRDANKLRRVDRLAGWLHQVALRTACRARSRSAAMTEVLVEDPVDRSDTLDKIAERHRLRALDEELDRLPEQYRTAIVLHYYEGCSYEETAERLNSTEPAVRGRLQRGREKLQRRLLTRGVSLSVAAVSLEAFTMKESVGGELVRQTVDLAAGATSPGPIAPNIETLLLTESTLMISPTILGTIAASVLTVSGLLATQFVVPTDKGKQSATINVAAATDRADATDTPTVAQNSNAQSPSQRRQPAASAPRMGMMGMGTMGGDGSGREMDEGMGATSDMEMGSMMGMGMGMDGMENFHEPEQMTSLWSTPNAERVAKIESKLSEDAILEFIEEPLENVATQLADKFEIPFVIDTMALEELGLTPDMPITLKTPEVSLESALELMINGLDLSYTISNEVVKLTTVEKDEGDNQLIRVYWCGNTGLQATEAGAGMLQSMIDPDTWEIVGGVGSISVLESGTNQASGFAIRSTYRTHRKIERFLESIRSGSQGPMTGTASAIDNNDEGGFGGGGGGFM